MRSTAMALLAACLAAGCEGQAKLPPAADTQGDPLNCGQAGNVCPTPPHASAVCIDGACGRSECEPGWLDLQADAPGCETAVASMVPTGLVAAIPSTGTSLLQHAQSSPAHRNQAVLAQPTPALVGGAVEQTDGTYRNQPGFIAAFQTEVVP